MVHRWLRPEGLLVNIQPYGKRMGIEVRVGARRRPAGVVFDNATSLDDMRASLRTLAGTVADGLFSPRGEIFFELRSNFESPEDWWEFLQRPKAGGLEADRALLDEALDRLARGENSLFTIEPEVVAAYERRVLNASTRSPR